MRVDEAGNTGRGRKGCATYSYSEGTAPAPRFPTSTALAKPETGRGDNEASPFNIR